MRWREAECLPPINFVGGKMLLSKEELEKIEKEAKQKVRLSCDEYHLHTVNCLVGDENAITILKLIDHIRTLEGAIKSLADMVYSEK